MKTIFGRTFSATAALLIASFLLLGSSVSLIAMRSNRAEREDAMRTSAENLAYVAATYAYNGSVQRNSTLSSAVSLASDLSGFEIVITGKYGEVAATPEGVEWDYTLYVSREVMERVQGKGDYVSVGNLGGLYNSEFFTVGMPVRDGVGEFCGAVFVSVTSAAVQRLMVNFLRVFIVVAMLVLAVAGLWAYFYTRKLTQPLKDMAETSRSFARGDFSHRIDEEGGQVEETRELARSLNLMAESLDQSESRRREFIANISHELKTPMTSITGYVDGILDGVIPPEKQEQYLGIVSRETKRLSRLVTQMLEISRMEADEDQPLNLSAFDLSEMARLVLIGQAEKINEKKLEVELDLDEPAEVIGDRDNIYRVVWNLVENAVKYSDEETALELSVKKKGGRVHFALSDIGRPIPPDERERIFERFHQTDRSRRSEGLGLGLYLVKRIMLRHGEDVVCIPEGKKTTMKFGLPAKRETRAERKQEKVTN